jgi:hypothetical protein
MSLADDVPSQAVVGSCRHMQNVDRSTGAVPVVRERVTECRRKRWLDFVWNTRQYGLRLAVRWLRQKR